MELIEPDRETRSPRQRRSDTRPGQSHVGGAAKGTSVRNWDRNLEITEEPFAQQNLPLAGFSVIEAENLQEVIELVSNTPCARARGVIEIRPFWDFGNDDA